jgi:hypothetical protein
MKQYDNILVPSENEVASINGAAVPDFAVRTNFIVLTIEELSQLWNAGHRAGLSDAGRLTKQPAVDFEQYMASKGITIP